MIYTIKPLDTPTARLVIKYHKGFHSWRRLAIGRICLLESSHPRVSRGAVLGRDPGMPSALVLDVRQRDLISVMARDVAGGAYTWRHFRIGHDFEPQRLELPSKSFRWDDLCDLIEMTDIVPDIQVDSCDGKLRDFLAESHPAWLQEILDRQIQHWRTHRPERFLRLAPSRASEEEFDFCYSKFPLLTLANFHDRLSSEEIYWLSQRSLKGAVMYAFDVLTAEQITKAMDKYPREMIHFAATRMSDRQLRTCAYKEPHTAFDHRWSQPSRRRAAVLSITYSYCLLYYQNGPSRALHWEIIDSITKHPDVWLSVHGDRYETLFNGLRQYLGMTFDPTTLLKMLHGVETEYRQGFAEYIAGLI